MYAISYSYIATSLWDVGKKESLGMFVGGTVKTTKSTNVCRGIKCN